MYSTSLRPSFVFLGLTAIYLALIECMRKTKKKKTLEELKFFHFVRENVYAKKMFWKIFRNLNYSKFNLKLFHDST